MNRVRANSSPELISQCTAELQKDSNLEGAAANVKVLLKQIQDYPNVAKDDGGQKLQRVTGMISILDDVRTRIQRFQPPAVKNEARELRRCNTDLRRGGCPPTNPKDQKKAALDHPMTVEESQRLQREHSANVTARKGLEKMFSCLGKEKEIIAAELARKVAQLSAMEELVADLRAQNEMLTEKVEMCAAEHKGLRKNDVETTAPGGCGETQQAANAALQERNKLLSEQLLKSLDGYRTMKRRLKDAQEERVAVASGVAKAAEEAAAAVEIVQGLRQKMDVGGGDEAMAASLEQVLVGLQQRMAKLSSRRGNN